ncbi:family 43 glycosylhydrolase [Echinicola marina]|uniref:family 43 glycosylhydrolase n=1 Tax=Echinicola marina TaxID=2859768 RepID=UPI001CF6E02B|nr:family 43 glycosylhydrolase [Echinicola marina]UCS91645.1 family 43 glycosylhydrolase [Echinicola marina]
MNNYIGYEKTILLMALTFLLACHTAIGQKHNIKNDTFWDTQDGDPIYSQGGGIFTFTDPEDGVEKYYWYGVHYEEAELYQEDPSVTHKRTNFKAVTCYTSTDLVNWESKGPVLDKAEVEENYQRVFWMGRLGVAYIKEMNKYAILVQHNSNVLIALSDSPNGPFKCHNRLDMTDRIGTPNTGDQTVFTDPDTGISYLVYSYGKGRHKIYISEIGVKDGKVDLLDVTQIFKGKGREGNCMVKYNGKYYVFASNLYGWDSSLAYYLVSDDIRGPYLPENKMLITPGSYDDYAHITQTGFFVNVIGSQKETVIYCGDRWADFAGNGLGYNQWCPISFDGETPFFNSLNSWNLNESTGEWSVAEDNNFVKNSSFEADRKAIPSGVKPIQEQLLGWHSEVKQGNTIVIDDKESPVLNHANTKEDRLHVIGERSLNISDKVPFKRKVYQMITSTPYVPLEDGTYTLSFKVKSAGTFHQLEAYTESGAYQKTENVKQSDNWKTIRLEEVNVTNGKVEIGFIAHGAAGASCQIDDVAFVPSNVPAYQK